jgi:hypothetical protein
MFSKCAFIASSALHYGQSRRVDFWLSSYFISEQLHITERLADEILRLQTGNHHKVIASEGRSTGRFLSTLSRPRDHRCELTKSVNFSFGRVWGGFSPRLGPGPLPTAPAGKTLHKSTKISSGDRFEGTLTKI